MKPTFKEINAAFKYDVRSGILYRKFSKRPQFIGKPTGCLNGMGYIVVGYKDKLYAAHRVAWLLMTGAWPEKQIDHINRKKTDNRWGNLRQASNRENQQNKKITVRNKSGLKGICPAPSGGFQAYIKVSGRTIYLGTHDKKEQAHAAYLEAAKEHFGEFARSS